MQEATPETSADRLTAIRARMAAAAKLARRPSEDIQLIAVSKTRSVEDIVPLILQGQMLFGENRVQEAATKWPALKQRHPGVQLHLIGQLQSNKADEAVALFDMIHSVDRLSLVTALGKAMEERSNHDAAFTHYERANTLRNAELKYDPQSVRQKVDRVIAQCTPEFLASRAGQGHVAHDPIFILGMPRAGSTLIEQILASHSMVEGTMELPDIPAMALREGNDADWIDALAGFSAEDLERLGAEFMERTRIQRKTDKSFFIDKLPNNWNYLAFIRLILPNAKIIDARRHPLDCCFSNYRQHFAKGQAFSYDLAHLGQYYADYVRLMAHFDAVEPGSVYRVIHEQLLENPEGEIRSLLEFLGLPFEESCLNFHQNKRAVRTASSEQVRRPINRDGVDQWKPYAAHLEPLKRALGDYWKTYPAIS